jgi:S-adenosylmethionine decarboxylase
MWGKELLVDLYNCNDISRLTDKNKLTELINYLCKEIDIEKMGETHFQEYTGKDEKLKGWSICQFIRTSSIVFHITDKDKTVYIDLFSCKDFDEESVLKILLEYFEPEKYNETILIRK